MATNAWIWQTNPLKWTVIVTLLKSLFTCLFIYESYNTGKNKYGATNTEATGAVVVCSISVHPTAKHILFYTWCKVIVFRDN